MWSRWSFWVQLFNEQRSICPFFSACLTPMLHCSHISFLESCQPEFPSINHSVGRLVEAANSLFRTANGDGWECGWVRRGEVKRRASEAFTLTCFSNWSNTVAVWNWGWWKNQFSIYSWHQAFILKCRQGLFVIICNNLKCFTYRQMRKTAT